MAGLRRSGALALAFFLVSSPPFAASEDSGGSVLVTAADPHIAAAVAAVSAARLRETDAALVAFGTRSFIAAWVVVAFDMHG